METVPETAWDLLLRGYSVAEIAAQLRQNVTQAFQSLSNILEQLREETEWLRDRWFEIGLVQLKRVQTAAWDAWSRSWLPKSKTTRKKVRDAKGERDEEVTISEESHGDARYLSLYYKCINDIGKWWEKYLAKPPRPPQPEGDPRAQLANMIQAAMARKEAAGR